MRVPVPDRTRRLLRQWYPEDLTEETTVVRGSVFGWLFGRFGQHAVTVNRTVHLTSDAPGLESDAGIVLLGHELYHVVQQQEMGWWRFIARYVWSWRPSHVSEGWRHPLEEPAYARGREIRGSLG